MSHGIHDLEGPVLFDSCTECRDRGADVHVALSCMDPETFARAWDRAVTLHRDGLEDVQMCELPTLRALWAVQLQFERRGLPVGAMPVNA